MYRSKDCAWWSDQSFVRTSFWSSCSCTMILLLPASSQRIYLQKQSHLFHDSQTLECLFSDGTLAISSTFPTGDFSSPGDNVNVKNRLISPWAINGRTIQDRFVQKFSAINSWKFYPAGQTWITTWGPRNFPHWQTWILPCIDLTWCLLSPFEASNVLFPIGTSWFADKNHWLLQSDTTAAVQWLFCRTRRFLVEWCNRSGSVWRLLRFVE